MKRELLLALAEAFERSRGGRTGLTARAFSIPVEALLRAAGCADGTRRETALQILKELDGELVTLRRAHRDPATITRIDLDPAREADLYDELGEPSPTKRREALAELFATAARRDVPKEDRQAWIKACQAFSSAAASGAPLAPFPRDLAQAKRLLEAAHKLLNWREESLARFASCVLFGNSKTLENLRGTLDRILAAVTQERVTDLREVGILDNPRVFAIRGPVSFHFPEGILDLRLLRAPMSFSLVDVQRAVRIELHVPRVCTVENTATFHELGKLQTLDTVFVCTEGYVGSAQIELVRRLPDDADIFHFGDSDPAGFDILRDLRSKSDRTIGSIHMQHRPATEPVPLTDTDLALLERLLAGADLVASERSVLQTMKNSGDKGRFEQEQLGSPRLARWPYYE